MHQDNGVPSQQHRPTEETAKLENTTASNGKSSSAPSAPSSNQSSTAQSALASQTTSGSVSRADKRSLEVSRRRRQSSAKSTTSSSSSSVGKLDTSKDANQSAASSLEDSIIYEMKLVDNVIRSMRVGKVFRDNQDNINHMHFSGDGASLISSSDDDQIVIYDCERGTQKRTLNSRKYGVDLIHFTQNKSNVVHASTKENDIIRYLNVSENKYIQYFRGHNKRVVTLCMNPTDDSFLSGSLDKSIRLWDIRSQYCQGFMNLAGRPVAAFDPEGLIFAVGINSESVKLYDLRSFDKGPFSSFKFPSVERDVEWTGLKFSPDGKTILVSTNGSMIKLIDAFSGSCLQTFTGHINSKQIPLEASFSPDSQFVISGSTDGRVHIWNAENGTKVCVLNGDHTGPVQCVQFNPKYMMMASSCKNMAFWLPSVDEDT